MHGLTEVRELFFLNRIDNEKKGKCETSLSIV